MLLRWNMLFFDFCVRYLRLFDYFSAGKTALLEQCCRKNAKLGHHNGAAGNAPSWYCRNSAAKLAASWARLTKLAASMANIYQTCSKYGSPSHTWRISGSTGSSGSSSREEDGRASCTTRGTSRQRQNVFFLWYGYSVVWIRPATWCVDEQQTSA